MGDYKSFKQFIEANTFTEGIWRPPGDERKTYSDGNTTITWWEKKMEFSGKDADEIKLWLCNVLITNVLGVKKMAGGGDNGSDLSTGPCKCNSLTSSTETMIELLSLKEEVNGNTS